MRLTARALTLALAAAFVAAPAGATVQTGYLSCAADGDRADSATAWSWSGLTEFTWEAMVKLDSSTSTWRTILSTVTSPASSSANWYADRNSTEWNHKSTFAKQSGTVVVMSGVIADQTVWHRYSVTFSSGTYRIYIDGTQTGSAGTETMPTGPDGVIRLCEYADGPDDLAGKIADVRLFNVDKGATWIADHKDCRVKATTTGLVDLWTLDGVATNSVAGGHGSVTLAGNAAFESASPPSLESTGGADCILALPSRSGKLQTMP